MGALFLATMARDEKGRFAGRAEELLRGAEEALREVIKERMANHPAALKHPSLVNSTGVIYFNDIIAEGQQEVLDVFRQAAKETRE
jgi:hypothetical protein